jgi:hypothetical protein
MYENREETTILIIRINEWLGGGSVRLHRLSRTNLFARGGHTLYKSPRVVNGCDA